MPRKTKTKRPPRIYTTKSGRKYIKRGGKRLYFTTEASLERILKLLFKQFDKNRKTKRRRRKRIVNAKKPIDKIDVVSSSFSRAVQMEAQAQQFEKAQTILNAEKKAIEGAKKQVLLLENGDADMRTVRKVLKKVGVDINDDADLQTILDELGEREKIMKGMDATIEKERKKHEKEKEKFAKEKSVWNKKKELERERQWATTIPWATYNDLTAAFGTTAFTEKGKKKSRVQIMEEMKKAIPDYFEDLKEDPTYGYQNIRLYGDSDDEEYDPDTLLAADDSNDDVPALDDDPTATGNGRGTGKGLSNIQINSMMKKYKRFSGVYASDELHKLPLKSKMGFVMNTQPIRVSHGHWIAVYIDIDNDRSIEYYDPLADEPSESFMKDIKKLIDKLKTKTYLKFKINKIRDQDVRSNNCGWHSINFLIGRFKNKPFKDVTGFTDTRNGEAKVKLLKKKFKYI